MATYRVALVGAVVDSSFYLRNFSGKEVMLIAEFANKQRNLVWQRPFIEQQRSRIKDQLVSIGRSDEEELIRASVRVLKRLNARSSHLEKLHAYLTALEVLRISGYQRFENASEFDRHLGALFRLLQSEGIRPRSSRIAYLFSELQFEKSDFLKKQGKELASLWYGMLGLVQGNYPLDGDTIRKLEEFKKRSPAFSVSPDSFPSVSEGPSALSESEIRPRQLRQCRFQGNFTEGDRLVGEDQSSDLHWQWERASYFAVKEKSLKPLFPMVRKGLPHYSLEYLIDFSLWSMAVQTKEFLFWGANTRSLKRLASCENVQNLSIIDHIRRLEKCYDKSRDLPSRIKLMGDILLDIDEVSNLQWRMLLLAASARWLIRVKSVSLALPVLIQYRKLSLWCSQGKQADSFGVVEDLAHVNLDSFCPDLSGERNTGTIR